MAAPQRILRSAQTVNEYPCMVCHARAPALYEEVQHRGGVFISIRCLGCGEKLFADQLKTEKLEKLK